MQKALEKGRNFRGMLTHRIIGNKCELHLIPLKITNEKDDMKFSEFTKKLRVKEQRDELLRLFSNQITEDLQNQEYFKTMPDEDNVKRIIKGLAMLDNRYDEFLVNAYGVLDEPLIYPPLPPKSPEAQSNPSTAPKNEPDAQPQSKSQTTKTSPQPDPQKNSTQSQSKQSDTQKPDLGFGMPNR